MLRSVPPVLVTLLSSRNTLPAPVASTMFWLASVDWAMLMVPPESALIVPRLSKLLPLPLTSWPTPIVPVWPRTTMFAPSVAVALPPSTPSLLLPMAPKTKLPMPPMVCVPSRLMRLPLSMLAVPFNVKPSAMRCKPRPVATSRLPLSVTPRMKFAALLNTTTLPVSVVLMVPPVMVLPNWLTTLPAAMLITPPVLLMLWPAETPRLAVLAPPTLMTPLLVVPPPPTRLRPNASMVICPALLRFNTDCPVLMVVALPSAMVALSTLPGTTPQLQLAAVPQLPETGFQVHDAALALPMANGANNVAAASANAWARGWRIRRREERAAERGRGVACMSCLQTNAGSLERHR